MPLTTAEYLRYSRQITLPEVGTGGQERLKNASVLCIGAGGLGSPVTMQLAAAGVGRIGVVDDDKVELSNLHRQLLHHTGDVGLAKVDSARATLASINPHVEIIPHPVRFTAENAREIAEPYDLIIDGTDNFPTRYLSNDLAVLTTKPNIYGSIFRFEGQVSVFAPHLGGPCYRCLFPEPPRPGQIPSCAEGGVLGVLPNLVGSLQATEALKLLLGTGRPMIGRLLHLDALAFRFREITLKKDPGCAICGEHPTIHHLADLDFSCDMNTEKPADEIDVHELKQLLDQGSSRLLLDVREPEEIAVASLPGTIQIPLGELPGRMHELDPEAEILLLCRSGVRSRKALEFLRQSGYEKLWNVTGGILAWSREIDPSVPQY